ncbi:MAG: DUF5752 family protein [Patescibacteria group bacterium]
MKPVKKSAPLKNVPPEKAFWFNDGQVAKNLKECAAILEKIDQKVFSHHVNAQKNDFSCWLEDVFGQTTLAKQIAKIKTAKTMAQKIKAQL